MAKLKNIWLNPLGPEGVDGVNGVELRLDWDNDRHQAVRVPSLECDAILDVLWKVHALLVKERNQGRI